MLLGVWIVTVSGGPVDSLVLSSANPRSGSLQGIPSGWPFLSKTDSLLFIPITSFSCSVGDGSRCVGRDVGGIRCKESVFSLQLDLDVESANGSVDVVLFESFMTLMRRATR